MIISHKYKFIFIKTGKTAGTSIEVYLSQHCGPDDVVTPVYPPIEPHQPRNFQGRWNPLPEIILKRGHRWRSTLRKCMKKERFHNHIPAWLVKCRVSPQLWNGYYKFCVERNPWDKTISDYNMINDRAGGGISFDAYLEKGDFCINYPRYTDFQGNLLVDRIVKYESLMPELGDLFAQLGVPFAGSLGVRAKSEHRKDRRPYREIYTPRQREIVEKAFTQEIKMHDYHF